MSLIPISVLLSLALLAAEDRASTRAHPFLLSTPADLERARASAAGPGPLGDLARRLAEEARRESIEDLPPLERKWWEGDRAKPWSETYPQIFHHTWIVPARWADLARRCAWAAALEPGSPLGDKGKRILLALAEYTFEFEHYDVGMNYTVWGIVALEAYDVLLGVSSVDLSPEERSRIDAFFGRFLEAVQKNDAFWVDREPGGSVNNHYAWHKLGMAAYGLFYDRPDLVEEALRGPKGVEMLLRAGFVDDGLWLEGSIPYQLAATAPMVLLAEMLENAGYPRRLWRSDAGDGRTLEGSYDALMGLTFPDRTLPPVGDAYGRRPHLGRHPDWEALFRRFRSPRYAWLIRDRVLREGDARAVEALLRGVPELPEAPPPPQESRLWVEHGYAALRSVEGPAYWSGRGWTLFATWGVNPVHANADRLSIQIFAEGHLWLPDCEARTSAEHAFSSRVQGALNRETLSHNTVLVDRSSQRAPSRRLDLVEFHLLPSARRLTVGDLEGLLYPGVHQLRTCIVREGFILDLFQVEADSERRMEWLLHVDGEGDGEGEGATEDSGTPAEVPVAPPWSYLRAPRFREIPPRWGETFTKGSGRFRVDVFIDVPDGAGGGAAWVLAAGFPRDDGPDPATIPLRAIGTRGRSVRFLAVYRCGEPSGAPLDARIAPGPLGSLEVDLRLGERTFLHRAPALGAVR